MEQKTLNAKQLLTIEECRVVRRHLKADLDNLENGTFRKYDPTRGQYEYGVICPKPQKGIFHGTYVF
jgi:hypothetical protein